jgi:hypothetical protein
MTIQSLLENIDSKFNTDNKYILLKNRLQLPCNYKTVDIDSANINNIYSKYDNTESNLKLYLNKTAFEHTFYGLVNLLNDDLLDPTKITVEISKLNYSHNADIIKSYANLRDINKSINISQNNEKLKRNDIDKTKKVIDLQYYETLIVVILLIIFIIMTGVFNLNDKKHYIKYIIPILIFLFLIIHTFNTFFIHIEPFITTKELFGISDFKDNDVIKKNKLYTDKINNLPNFNNYYDVYYYLTDYEIDKNPDLDLELNKLVTLYSILDMMNSFKKNDNKKDEYIYNNINNSEYIKDIDTNLKKEVKKNIYAYNVIKISAKNAEKYYNDIYMSSLYYRDIVYLLIYLTIISILLNVVFIEFGYDYTDTYILGLYLFLFILGIFIYSYRYLIRVRTNPTNRYF